MSFVLRRASRRWSGGNGVVLFDSDDAVAAVSLTVTKGGQQGLTIGTIPRPRPNEAGYQRLGAG